MSADVDVGTLMAVLEQLRSQVTMLAGALADLQGGPFESPGEMDEQRVTGGGDGAAPPEDWGFVPPPEEEHHVLIAKDSGSGLWWVSDWVRAIDLEDEEEPE